MDQEIEVVERHPFRLVVKLLLLVGVVYVAARFAAEKKKEFAGLTESEARDKLVEKISAKVGDETANDIAEQVIPKLREKGLFKSDPVSENAEEADDETEAAD